MHGEADGVDAGGSGSGSGVFALGASARGGLGRGGHLGEQADGRVGHGELAGRGR